MQDSYVPSWSLRVISIMHPGICSVGFWMTTQAKDFYNPFPHRLTLKGLSNWQALDVPRLCAVQSVDHVFQFFDVIRHND